MTRLQNVPHDQHLLISLILAQIPGPALLTRPVVGLVAGVCDLRSQLQVVSGFVVRRAVGAQRKHAAGETGQVAHLPLQVAVLPLADKCQTAVGFAYQVALDGLRKKKKSTLSVRGCVQSEECSCFKQKKREKRERGGGAYVRTEHGGGSRI